jgi:hypothetical protein
LKKASWRIQYCAKIGLDWANNDNYLFRKYKGLPQRESPPYVVSVYVYCGNFHD